MNITSFRVDYDKCIGCGLCEKVCPGGILHLNTEHKCEIDEITGFGWNGCWKCEHCLAVCPKGAISIFDKLPDDCTPPVKPEIAAPVMDALVMNRHSCRRFLQKDVPTETIDAMLELIGNAPITGLGRKTAIVALVIYNQYLLLRNYLAGLDGVDPGIVEAATGMGMTHLQLLWKVQIPLAKKALIAGLRIALVSTVGIATIAASINAGGLGTILFDGLRTMNTAKILWGSLLSAVLAVGIDRLLILIEKKTA